MGGAQALRNAVRRPAARAHQESEERYRSLFEQSLDPIAIIESEPTRFSYINQAFTKLFGYTREDVYALDVDGMPGHDPSGGPGPRAPGTSAIGSPASQQNARYELRVLNKSGEILWVDVQGNSIDFKGVPASQTIYRDITERKHAEEALRESQQQYLNIIDFFPDAVFVVDNDKRVIVWNKAMEEMSGVPKEDMLGRGERAYAVPFYGQPRRQLLDLLDAPDEDLEANYKNIQRNGQRLNAEIFAPALHGGQGAHIWVTGAPLYNLEGERVGAIEALRDITAQKKVEEALRFSQFAIDHMSDAAYWIESDGRITYANEAACRCLGYTAQELTAMIIQDVDPNISTEQWPELWDKLEQHRELTFETAHRTKNGRIFPVEVRANQFVVNGRVFNCAFARDITERKRLQEAMIQTEKMMSVGGLAAGMAHEINNPLSGILQNVQVIQRRLSEESPTNTEAARRVGCSFEAIRAFMAERDILAFLEGIREAGRRAAHTVSSMLEFSRKSESTQGMVDLNLLLDKAVDLCATDYDLKKKYDFRHISIERHYDTTLPDTPCSPPQIQQVVMNLLRNAAQAMASSPGRGAADAITPHHPQAGEPCGHRGGGQRPGHGRGHPAQGLRAVLHHQAARGRHGAGAFRVLFHHHQQPPGDHRGADLAGQGHPVHHPPAPGRSQGRVAPRFPKRPRLPGASVLGGRAKQRGVLNRYFSFFRPVGPLVVKGHFPPGGF